MDSRIQDVIGKRFNHLTVLERVPQKDGATHRLKKVLAQCDCGSVKEYFLSNIQIGNSKSCGCSLGRKEKHPAHGGKEYRAWKNMKQRCLNERSAYYPLYGGRGISVSQSWLKFENFYADMGECPDGMTLERKDNDQGYSAENCIWTDRKSQAMNRRTSLANRLKTTSELEIV